jgi:hypothetical protein
MFLEQFPAQDAIFEFWIIDMTSGAISQISAILDYDGRNLEH